MKRVLASLDRESPKTKHFIIIGIIIPLYPPHQIRAPNRVQHLPKAGALSARSRTTDFVAALVVLIAVISKLKSPSPLSMLMDGARGPTSRVAPVEEMELESEPRPRL